jgi:hypothetical protein
VTIPSRCTEACRCKYAMQMQICRLQRSKKVINSAAEHAEPARHHLSARDFHPRLRSTVALGCSMDARCTRPSVCRPENATIATGSRGTDTADTLDDLVVGLFISRLLGPITGCSDHSLLGNGLFLYVGLASRKILGDLDTAAAGIWIMALQWGWRRFVFTGNRACVVRSDTSVDWLRRRHFSACIDVRHRDHGRPKGRGRWQCELERGLHRLLLAFERSDGEEEPWVEVVMWGPFHIDFHARRPRNGVEAQA